MNDPDKAQPPEQAGEEWAEDNRQRITRALEAARDTAGLGPADERRGQSDALNRELIDDRDQRLGEKKGGKN